MGKKLLSRLKEIEWKLAVSIAGAGVLLAVLSGTSLVWWSLILFGGWLLGFYFSESRERRSIGAAFWIAAILAAWGVDAASHAEAPFYVPFGIIIAFMAVLSVCEALFRFVFRDRVSAYGVLNIGILFSLLLLFFSSPLTWFTLIAAGIGIAVLLREFLLFGGIAWRGRIMLASVTLSFLSLELALMIRFMPLSAISSAAFLALLLLLVRDALSAHFEGRFNLAFALRGIVIFLFIAALILGTALSGLFE
jgi:hypothetical protein